MISVLEISAYWGTIIGYFCSKLDFAQWINKIGQKMATNMLHQLEVKLTHTLQT